MTNGRSKIRLLLAVVLTLNLGCIHTTSHETKPVLTSKDRSSYSAVFKSSNLLVKNLIYSQEKYPLEDFFTQLGRGEFKSAFKRARINYKPSNSSNEILKSLLNSGFVPVLIKAKNLTSTSQTISYDQFYLVGNGRHRSVNPERLPSHIRQFSPGAVAANIYNVAVVSVVAVMIVVLLAHSNGSGNIGDFTDEKVLNPIEKVTHVDYQRFVIRQKVLAPGEEISGLLFFSLESMADTEGFTLEHFPAF